MVPAMVPPVEPHVHRSPTTPWAALAVGRDQEILDLGARAGPDGGTSVRIARNKPMGSVPAYVPRDDF